MNIYFKIKSFHAYNFNNLTNKIKTKMQLLGIYSKPNFASLPNIFSRYTILRSPHVDKKSREQFEIRTYSKIIKISFNENTLNEKQKAKILINFIKNSTAGLNLTVVYEI